MQKLPVGRTVLGAYAFTFQHLGTIIGLIWLPLVVSALLNALPEIANQYGGGGELAAGTRAIESLAVSLLTLVLYAMVYVAITRQALGLRQGPATLHFSLGQPEFRMFGALLLVGVIAMGPLLIYMTGLLAALSINTGPTQGLVGLALALAGGLALVYVIARLTFLIVPVTVSEQHIDLVRGWTLTRANFWRIFAVLLAVGIPIFALETVAVAMIMGPDVATLLRTSANREPQALQLQLEAIKELIRRHQPALMGMGLILAPFSLGLGLSASAIAYRELTSTQTTA